MTVRQRTGPTAMAEPGRIAANPLRDPWFVRAAATRRGMRIAIESDLEHEDAAAMRQHLSQIASDVLGTDSLPFTVAR